MTLAQTPPRRPAFTPPGLFSGGNLGNFSEPPGNVNDSPAELYIPL